MTSFRPTPGQERWMLVAARAGIQRDAAWLVERIEGWTAVTALARYAFFILGVFAAGLIAVVFKLMSIPQYLLLTGLFLVAAAEWLIVQRRLFGAGIEEALELAGLLMIALQAVMNPVESLEIRASLLLALMLLAAGLRLLNPLFTTLSVMALSGAIYFIRARHTGGHISAATMASVFSFAVACAALYAGKVQFRRPSHDRMLNWLIIAMPLAAYVWFKAANVPGLSGQASRDTWSLHVLPMLMLMALGGAALTAGIRRRVHAPLIAGIVCAGCIAYELRNLTTLPLKFKLIVWGTTALLLTVGLNRHLRTPRRGITSKKFAEGSGSVDLLQLAGASALAPPTVPRPDAPFKGGGGTFGGGGASGNY
jgi:hypothetical protein